MNIYNNSMVKIPNENDAIMILKKALNEKVKTIKRFSTGSEHYVYDVKTKSKKNLVVRMGREDARKTISSAVYWYNILKPKGVPLSQLLFSEVEKNLSHFPVMIMERLRGKDLGDVYSELSQEQKRQLIQEIFNIQEKVSSLPMAQGYGYATSFEDKFLMPTWIALLQNQLDRSRRRTIKAGLININYVDKIDKLINEKSHYFSTIKPVGFLDDTTTKNVIVDNGKLTGIVDVDFVCFGDPLFVVALTQMALLSKGYNTDYISYWLELLKLPDDQNKILTLYTLIHCVGFMSELGHSFNKEKPNEAGKQEIQKLEHIFVKLLESYR